MSARHAENKLLASVSTRDRRRLLKQCQVVNLEFADVLYEPHQPFQHVYFPIDAAVSLPSPFDQRNYLEVELIGNEGMLGIPLVLGVKTSPFQAIVHGPGQALRMSAASFRSALASCRPLQRKLDAYVYVRLIQLAQTGACAAAHGLEARLARWLLMTRDRLQIDEFHLTHEFLARMLGVRRVGITNAASSLRRRELLMYSRGDIAILDPTGLEAASCTCYRAAIDTYDQLLG